MRAQHAVIVDNNDMRPCVNSAHVPTSEECAVPLMLCDLGCSCTSLRGTAIGLERNRQEKVSTILKKIKDSPKSWETITAQELLDFHLENR